MTDQNPEKTIKRAEDNLKRKLDWVARHDSRTAFTAGILIAMLGVLVKSSTSILTWNTYIMVAFVLAITLLSVSLTFIYFSQYPKVESLNSSLIFFGTIAGLKCDEFKKKFKSLTEDEYLDDLLSQTHINSEILKKKFDYLKISLRLLAVSIVPWLYIIYLSNVLKYGAL